ncbi:MAG: extracellular solute-binding protein, partial [Roseiflexus sp.]|nr:extracellular solute-binding protein [Roseiflexus sp.]
MQQRSFALFALILLLLVAACSSPSATQSPATPNATAPSQGVTLRWSVWGSPEELASHQAVADAFMQAHPSIKIVIEHTPWEGYHTKLKTIVASGDLSALPDVMFLGQDFNQYAS